MIVSVTIGETRDKVRDFAKAQGLTFTILLDETSDMARAFQVRAIPTSFFIDEDGVIQGRHTGALDEALIDEYIDPLLP